MTIWHWPKNTSAFQKLNEEKSYLFFIFKNVNQKIGYDDKVKKLKKGKQ